MRKLATAAAAFSAAIFLAHYILPYNRLLLCASLAAALSLTGFLFKSRTRLRIFITMLALAVGFAWSWTFTALFVAPAGNLHDQTATVTAVVLDYPTPRTRGHHVEISVRQDGYPSIGARLRYFRDLDIAPGDVIEFTARFSRTDGVDDSLRIDSMSARGSFLSAQLVGDVEVVGAVGRWRHFPQRLSAAVADMVDQLFPDDVTPFMQALLSGRRAELSADIGLNSALAASGLAHVVAISGLHVTFLMGFLNVFISRRKRMFAFVGIPVLVLFMAMTGFTPSVTRAGIMQVFLICAPIFRRESDSITSLSAALVLILTLNPYSIGSVGLHLSFAATFGVINFTGRINSAFTKILDRTKFYTNGGIKASAARFVASSFSTTFAAILFTGPLTAIHFSRISPIAPLANLLTLWAVSVAFTLGVVAVALGFIFFPLASIVAYPVAIAARYIIDIARGLALIPFAALYVSNALVVIWLVYIYAMFIALPAMRARLRQYLNPVCLAVITLCVVLFVTPLTSAAPHVGDMSATVLDVGQGQSIVITAGEHTALVDCGSLSGERAGSIAHEFLMSQGRTTIDILILTHFHADHVNGVEYLFSRTSIAALALPDPDESYLRHVAQDIIELARRRGADIIYVTETLKVSLGDAVLMLYPPLGDGGENERGLAVLCYSDNLRALITGDMDGSSERLLLRFAYLPEVELLIVGHHGSRHSTSDELLYAVRPDLAIISVGNNSFGHPAEATLERLERHNITVMRTDIMGSITVSGRTTGDTDG